MNKYTISTKNLQKAAFAVGCGFTVGKAVGELVSAVINGATLGVIQIFADHGNEAAQKACEKNGLKYKKDSEETESE